MIDVYDERVYWMWIQRGIGIANIKTRIVSDYYESAVQFYEQVISGASPAGFSEADIKKLLSHSINEEKNNYDKTLSLGYDILCPNSKNYPKSLKNIDTPPSVIYVWGDSSVLSSRSVSIVGTRSPQTDSYDIAYHMSSGFAVNNITVISGGALGIDTAAHSGALDSGGKTIAVLGCGLDSTYLPANADLRKKISKNGALISEFAIGSPASGKHFPIRNRVIAALGMATIVVQGKKNSGTMITAGYAEKYHKTIFAVPGNPVESINSGNNSLILDGAYPVVTYTDVLKRILPVNKIISDKNAQKPVSGYVIKDLNCGNKNIKKNEIRKFEKVEKIAVSEDKKEESIAILKEKAVNKYNLSEETKTVLEYIDEEMTDVDLIALKTKLPVCNILVSLTELEMYGIIEKSGSRRCKFIKS